MTSSSSHMKLKEVAQELQIGMTLLKRLVKDGSIPVVRFGRAVRVPRQGLDAYLYSQRAGSPGR